jgi:hypothetical protein
VNNRYVIGSQVKNAISFKLCYFSESTGALVRVLYYILLLETSSSAIVGKLPLTL